MEENFKLDIISPQKTFFSDDVSMVTLPAIEGDIGVLKNHINLITFLRPGLINIQQKDRNFQELYVEDGTVEFHSNNLTILASKVFKLNELTKENINEMIEKTEQKINNNDLNDKDKFILNHKLDVLRKIPI
tara:strand:+ start:157 stop:552 length:396 start_codon:yes stop_codon:yes gene_type:complete